MLLFLFNILICLGSKQDEEFWLERAKNLIHWEKEFKEVYNGEFGNDMWFSDGKLNACYNCIDRWAEKTPNKTAIIFNDNFGETKSYSYYECLVKILEISNFMQNRGLKAGDSVTIYLPMSPFAIFSVLACARLGIIHNCVFGGFKSQALKWRIKNSESKMLITQDYVFHANKQLDYITESLEAIRDIEQPNFEVLVYDSQNIEKNQDLHGSKFRVKQNVKTEIELYSLINVKKWSSTKKDLNYIACYSASAEDTLFYLYTSGSTGLPKGIIHTTGGYLVYAASTLLEAFDIKENDIFCCTADIAWITGHTYGVYGPLSLGITTCILQGVPLVPTERLFKCVDDYKITQLYTAPTVIRALEKQIKIEKPDLNVYNLTSLRSIGSVGEPINKDAYNFFSAAFGNMHVVDTYFQTETGGIVIASKVGIVNPKPECAAKPLSGIYPCLENSLNSVDSVKINPDLNRDLHENDRNVFHGLYITKSWPGIARGIINDKERFKNGYFSKGIYFTGDEARVDEDGDYWILGRADDVINVSAHRISTAEIESAAMEYKNVADAAAIGIKHEIKGSCIILFVVLHENDDNYQEKTKDAISKSIGSFCKPDNVLQVKDIPKTATGKKIRRALKSIAEGKETGELPTCINPNSVEEIKETIKKNKSN